MFGSMRGSAGDERLACGFGDQLSVGVPARAHEGRLPPGPWLVVHGEAVVVLGHRNDELSAGPPEQGGHAAGVEPVHRELGDEILVAEVGVWPVRSNMMVE